MSFSENNKTEQMSEEMEVTATAVPVETAGRTNEVEVGQDDTFKCSVQKTSKHVSVGVALKGAFPDITIAKITPGTLFGKTNELEPGMIIKSINGQKFSNALEAATFLKEAEGQLDLVIDRNLIRVTMEKPTPEAKVGLAMKGDTAPIVISKIHPDGIFSDQSKLKPGMALVRINGESFTNAQQAALYLKECQGSITVEARPCTQAAATGSSQQQQKQGREPPPGVKGGGQWRHQTYHGPTTMSAMALGCLCFGIGGILAMCCPCDERWVYIVDGVAYDEFGRSLGSAQAVTAK